MVTHGLMVIQPGSSPGARVDFKVFKTIDPDRYEYFQGAWTRLNRVRTGGLIAYARQALKHLADAESQMREQIKATDSVPAFARRYSSWPTSVSCLILTYCSSLHLYYEQMVAIVTRVHGESSTETDQVKRAFSRCYDSSFAYRLVFRLRNVLVHHSLNVIGLQIKFGTERTPNGLILPRQVLKAPLDRAAVVSAKKDLSAKLKRELLDLDEDPDLLELCNQAHAALEIVHTSIENSCNPTLLEDARIVCELDTMFLEHGDRALVAIPEGGITSTGAQIPHTPLYPEVFKYAQQIVERG